MWVRVGDRGSCVRLQWRDRRPGFSGSGPARSGREVGGFASDPGGAASDPGRVTLHRLNRIEYNNTVRDLLGTELTPGDDFPNDDRGYGFDNNADVLSLSPLHLEMYQGAAETLVAEALAGANRAEIFTCTPAPMAEEDCAREILGGFARRAWRRAVSDDRDRAAPAADPTRPG